MTQKELLDCVNSTKGVQKPFGGNNYEHYYGMGYWLKKYAYYPTSFPLCLHLEHGPNINNEFVKHDFLSDFDKILVHNNTKVNSVSAKGFSKVYIMGSPFVHYRKMNKIKQSKEAKGTIAFPYHSTLNIDTLTDWDLYCDTLLSLKEEFHPITICLHPVDIQKGLHSIFMNKGFEVVTAGNKYSAKFPERFYNVLRKHKYATSNGYMSSTLYAVEMNIPFFFLGNQNIEVVNHGNDAFALGQFKLRNFETFGDIQQTPYDLFDSTEKNITIQQRLFVERALGVGYHLNRLQLCVILWKAYFNYQMKLFKKKGFHNYINKIRYKLQLRTRIKKLFQ